ncbi:MAG TPA: hypothetical protein VG917_01535 [Patescibacteria group bacterium]|nr:hypothetical protein [Patescibacteria group bacterium]
MKQKIILLCICILSLSYLFKTNASAQTAPTSNNYKILDYGFGGGGTASSSSNNYSLFGTLGQVDQGSPSSSNYFLGAGLEYEIMASAPAAPTFVNQNNSYNKLHLTINRGGNDPTDYQYAIQIAASQSGTFQYVQADNTVGSNFDNSNWQTYPAWGGSSGIDVIGLIPGSIYYARVAARQGQFYTQSDWGPIATASTVNPTMSFSVTTTSQSVPPFTVAIGTINPGSVSTSSDKVISTVSTNAVNGAVVYVQGTNTGLKSTTAANYTIPSSSTDLAAALEGYGARGTTVSQSSGGPMNLIAPYNGSGNNVGILDTSERALADTSNSPITSGQVQFELKAKAKNTTPEASDYSDILTVVVGGDF